MQTHHIVSIILLTLCIASGAWLYAEEPKMKHTTDSMKTVKKNIDDEKAVLLDVRELHEWDDGHLKDATFVPLSRLKDGIPKKEKETLIPKKKIVYIHCRSGVRCLTAAMILKRSEYDVRPLKEGYKDLLDAGFPKADDAPKP